jgi:predicted DNA-binding transcriptional regulator AlpA
MRKTILRTQKVCEMLDISSTTLWRWRKAGQFPNPCRVHGSSFQGWSESVVNDWIYKNFSVDEEV